jgi:hypothetical protein
MNIRAPLAFGLAARLFCGLAISSHVNPARTFARIFAQTALGMGQSVAIRAHAFRPALGLGANQKL